jgi:hypothetical protein
MLNELDKALGLTNDPETFYGDVPDPEKVKQLAELRGLAEKVGKINKRVEVPFLPFESRNVGAAVQLIYPCAYYIGNKTERLLFADMLAKADSACMVVIDDGRICFTFDIMDMWKEFHYEDEPDTPSGE